MSFFHLSKLLIANWPAYLHNLTSVEVPHIPCFSSKEKNFIIFSDSISSLEAIGGFKLEIDIVQNIIKDYTHLADSGKTIILCWIPSHVNIRGSERADTAAKSALSLPVTNMKLPARELLPCISNLFSRMARYMGLLRG